MSKAGLVALMAILVIAGPISQVGAEQDPAAEASGSSPAQVVVVPPGDLFAIIGQVTVEQRTRMSRFLANKYPALGTDLLGLLASQYPEALGKVTNYIDHLIKTKYPEIAADISTQLQRTPAVQPAIEKLIANKYPQFVADLQKASPQADISGYAAALIREKYPTLLPDILTTITTKFPALLVSLQHQVIGNHPGILIDVARMVQKQHPELTNDVLIMVLSNYPDLLPGVLAILNETPSPGPGPPSIESEVATPDQEPAPEQ